MYYTINFCSCQFFSYNSFILLILYHIIINLSSVFFKIFLDFLIIL
nr:MAG TPA: hypothetical protein [Caudoviricetes sp.]